MRAMYQFSIRPVTLQSVWMMSRAPSDGLAQAAQTGYIRSVAADRAVAVFDALGVRSLVET